MKKPVLFITLLMRIVSVSMAQYLPMAVYDGDAGILSRLELQDTGAFKAHSSIGRPVQEPYFQQVNAASFQQWLPLIVNNSEYFSSKNDTLSELLQASMRSRPLWKRFNTNKSHFFSSFGEHGYLTIDPLLDFSVGRQNRDGVMLLTNRRGLRLTAGIDRKVYLFSELTENQFGVQDHVRRYASLYKAFPGAGFVKAYDSRIFNIRDGYDFILAEGGLSFKATRHIALELGHGRHFIGQGIRSLLLSDFSAPQFYLKIQSRWGAFRYVNIFSELSGENRFINDTDHLLDKKYAASHYLSCNVTKNWNIGLFESVVFRRKNDFELQYLNPIILYRAIEQAVGSPDNVLVGLQSHLNLLRKFTVYGQVVLDEFVFNRLLKDNNGWWANKYGLQAGIRYPNAFGVKGLMLQAEYNMVRPFTYSYADSSADYTHYHQALAHPLGANFREWLTSVQYHPDRRWTLTLNWMHFTKGLDTDSTNYGGNILKSYNTRYADFGNKTGQGIRQRVDQLEFRVSYQCLARTWLDLATGWRDQLTDASHERYFWIQTGLRMYLTYRNFIF